MAFRALVRERLLLAAVQCRSALSAASQVAFHTSSQASRKKKQPFYNKYHRQLKNRYRIYTGYAHEVLQKQDERTRNHLEDIDDHDFEEELLREGRRRRGAYLHSKGMRDVTKGPGPRLLTWEQMEHVRFLNQTEPDEWTIEMLSHSFQVPELVIRKVLRSKRILGRYAREKLDAKAHENRGIAQLPTATSTKKTQNVSLVRSEQATGISNGEQWGLPDWKNHGWFSGYDLERTRSNGKPRSRKADVMDGVSWLEEDESEFYSYVYRAEEDWWDGKESCDTLDETDEVKPKEPDVTTDDGKNFHDSDGAFLYRI